MEATPSPANNIALLIDADNAPASKIDFIFSELAGHGVVNIRRAYGNWKKHTLSGWEKVLHENSIQPMQTFDLVPGKNATDMALVIDAIDLLYTKNVQTFCIVSSDCDFTPLIQRIRADGKEVFGFGSQRTPKPFIASCTRFLYLDEEPKAKAAGKVTGESNPQASSLKDPKVLKGDTKLMNTLRGAVKRLRDEGKEVDAEGWVNLAAVGSRISAAGPFDHRTYGFKKLSDLFAAIDLFEMKKEMNGTQTHHFVRIPKGGKTKPAG